MQVFYRRTDGGTPLGAPITTDSAGSFNGVIAPCPSGKILGFVINSQGGDGSFRTYNSGARQQFATTNYYRGNAVIAEFP